MIPMSANVNKDEREAVRLASELDSVEKVRVHKEILMEKWSGYRNGKHHPELDWLGQSSVDRGFPEVKGDYQRGVMAMLLENQLRFQQTKTPRVVGNKVILQDTTTSDEALPTKFALPIVRRVYALMVQNDWSVVQPLPGPTGYVFWLDFLRETDSTNLLSVEYNALTTGELAVPTKGKLQLNRATLTVIKQIMGLTWSLEALEDARAQLGIDVESELLQAFSAEFVRNLYGRHLKEISTQAQSGTATGSALVNPWAGPNTTVSIPARGATAIADYKSIVYNSLLDADTNFQRANRVPSTGIIAGFGMAGFLRKMLTATATDNPDMNNLSSVGLTHYGNFAARWNIWGTDFLKDDMAFLYHRSPDNLHAAHVYAPYIPVQVMPAVYGDYDTTTGNYQNKDAYTRNIRERSAHIVTKPYGFQPVQGPGGLVF